MRRRDRDAADAGAGPWQPTQVFGVSLNSPRTWQLSQRVRSCAPVSAKPGRQVLRDLLRASSGRRDAALRGRRADCQRSDQEAECRRRRAFAAARETNATRQTGCHWRVPGPGTALPVRGGDAPPGPNALMSRNERGVWHRSHWPPKSPPWTSSAAWQVMQVVASAGILSPATLVAGDARHLCVRAVERITGAPRVVEVPDLPVARVVARAQSVPSVPLVLVVLRVARDAFALRVLEGRRRVAGLAFDAQRARPAAGSATWRGRSAPSSSSPPCRGTRSHWRPSWSRCLSSFRWQA